MSAASTAEAITTETATAIEATRTIESAPSLEATHTIEVEVIFCDNLDTIQILHI